MARAANCAKEQIQWDDEVEGNKKKCFVKKKKKLKEKTTKAYVKVFFFLNVSLGLALTAYILCHTS